MINQMLFFFQIAMSLLVFGLIAGWYVTPRLARLPIVDALTPLLLFHAFRYFGSSFLTSSVVDPNLPPSFAIPGAAGDVLTAFLALIALWALRSRSSLSLPLLWAFSVVGTLDLLNAFYHGLDIGLQDYRLGTAWFIITLYVPALIVVHGLVYRILLSRSSELRLPRSLEVVAS